MTSTDTPRPADEGGVSRTFPFTRGTKTVRIKTARLVAGDRVLTTQWEGLDNETHNKVQDAQVKTGSIVRTVERLQPVFETRRTFHTGVRRTYTVYFTDGTYSEGHAPILTWHAVAGEDEVA